MSSPSLLLRWCPPLQQPPTRCFGHHTTGSQPCVCACGVVVLKRSQPMWACCPLVPSFLVPCVASRGAAQPGQVRHRFVPHRPHPVRRPRTPRFGLNLVFYKAKPPAVLGWQRAGRARPRACVCAGVRAHRVCVCLAASTLHASPLWVRRRSRPPRARSKPPLWCWRHLAAQACTTSCAR